MSKTLHPKIEAARYKLLNDRKLGRPYLAAAAYSLKPCGSGEGDGCPTMAVSKNYCLYWNDSWVESLSVAELAAVLYHEIRHLLDNHFARLAYLPPHIANVCGDLSINDDLEAEGFALPNGALLPRQFGFPDGLLAEEYADLLANENSASGSGSGSGGGRQEKDDGSGAGGTPEEGNENGGGDQQPFGGGSASTGRSPVWEGQEEEKSKAEIDAIRQAVAEAVLAAGKAPAGLKRWAEAVARKKINWRALLRCYLASHCGTSHTPSFARPSRRHSPGVILAGSMRESAEIAFVVDTSGSMLDEDIAAAAREAVDIARHTGVTVHLVECDAAVANVTYDLRKLPNDLSGGGGTDLSKALKAIQSDKRLSKARAVIVVTDGADCGIPEKPFGKPVIVLLTNKDGYIPAWCSVINWEA